MDFAQRIRMLREEHGLTRIQLCEKADITVASLKNWESGNAPSTIDSIVSICNVLNISADTLLGTMFDKRVDPLLSAEDLKLLEIYRALDNPGRKVLETVASLEKERIDEEAARRKPALELLPELERPWIPYYVQPSAAGPNNPLDNDDFEKYYLTDGTPLDADCVVRIRGISMEPYIHNGEDVFVKRTTELSNGDIGIFAVDNALYCKHYYLDEDRNLYLVSANPEAKRSNVFVSADSGSSVVCYGRVLLDIKPRLPEYFLSEISD